MFPLLGGQKAKNDMRMRKKRWAGEHRGRVCRK